MYRRIKHQQFTQIYCKTYKKYTYNTNNLPVTIFNIFLRTFLQVYNVINSRTTHNTTVVAHIMVLIDINIYLIYIDVHVSRVCSMFRRLARKKNTRRGGLHYLFASPSGVFSTSNIPFALQPARAHSSCGVTAASIRHTW